MEEYDADPVLGLLALTRPNETDSGIANEPGWFPINFEDSIVYNQPEVEDLERSVVTYPAVFVRYRDEWRDDGIGVPFAQEALD